MCVCVCVDGHDSGLDKSRETLAGFRVVKMTVVVSAVLRLLAQTVSSSV